MSVALVIAQAAEGIFGSVTDLVVSSPNRIGRGIVRENRNNLSTSNDDLIQYFTSVNESTNKGVQYEPPKKDYTALIIVSVVVAAILFLIFKNK